MSWGLTLVSYLPSPGVFQGLAALKTRVCNTRLLFLFNQTLHLKDLFHVREFVLLFQELIETSGRPREPNSGHVGQRSPGAGTRAWGCQRVSESGLWPLTSDFKEPWSGG